MNNSNRFFLYEAEIMRAANHSLHEVMKYWEEGRKVYYGTPQSHDKDITSFAEKITLKYVDYKNACGEVERRLVTQPSLK